MRALILIAAALSLSASAAASPQQTEQPPPRYERLRPVHRPPREDTFFNLGPLLYKGIELHGGWLGGRGLEMNVPDTVEVQGQGMTNPYEVLLRYDRMDFEADEAGATFDMNLFRFSVDGMKGRWQADGTLLVNDSIHPATQTPVSVHGDFWGARLAVYWPALRVRSGTFEATFGPEAGVAWYYEGLHGVPQSPLPMKDRLDEMIGSLGPKLSLRLIFEDADASLNVTLPYLAGAIRGWLAPEATVGFGIRF